MILEHLGGVEKASTFAKSATKVMREILVFIIISGRKVAKYDVKNPLTVMKVMNGLVQWSECRRPESDDVVMWS